MHPFPVNFFRLQLLRFKRLPYPVPTFATDGKLVRELFTHRQLYLHRVHTDHHGNSSLVLLSSIQGCHTGHHVHCTCTCGVNLLHKFTTQLHVQCAMCHPWFYWTSFVPVAQGLSSDH